MKKMFLLALVLGVFMAGNAYAVSTPLHCYGGLAVGGYPYWALTDNDGNPLLDTDCVCIYWAGPDQIVDGIDVSNPPQPLGDDVIIECGGFYYSTFDILLGVGGAGEGHPEINDVLYAVIYDGPCDGLTGDNYYGMSTNTHTCLNTLGDAAYFYFPGDPYGGYTDTPLPVELMTFDAIARDSEVLLEWKTASETNLLGFYIERDDARVSDLIEGHGNSTTEQTYTYLDKNVDNGNTYSYNLITVDLDGVEMVANEEPVLATPTAHVPTAFALHQNYPNPFNPVTEIKYDVPKDVHVTLKVYNVLGAEVATLVDANQKASFYTVQWDAKDLASGVYFCTLNAGDFKAVKKMVLLK
jgi:hypothetical protein